MHAHTHEQTETLLKTVYRWNAQSATKRWNAVTWWTTRFVLNIKYKKQFAKALKIYLVKRLSQSDHCAERLQTCLFCKLLLPWKELGQHQHICGSRTELCGDCRCYVTLWDQPVHWTTCPATSAPSQTNSNPSSDTSKRMQPERLWFKLQTWYCFWSYSLFSTAKSRVRRDRCKASIPAEGIEKRKVCLKDCREIRAKLKGLAACLQWEVFLFSLRFSEIFRAQQPSNLFDDLEKATQANTRKTASIFSIQETQPAPGSSHKVASFSDRVRDGGDDIGTCPHCYLTLPIPTLLRHQVKLLHHMRHCMIEVFPW